MKSRGLDQAYRMQDFAYEASMALREALTLKSGERAGKLAAPTKEDAAAIGTLGKVWKDAQEQIRIHKGKPLPGSLTYEKVGGRRTAKRVARGGVMLDQHGDDQPSQPGEPTQGEQPGEPGQPS